MQRCNSRGYGSVAEQLVANQLTGVRFPLPAPRSIIPLRAHGEMDITPVFGTGVLGSNPGGRTKFL